MFGKAYRLPFKVMGIPILLDISLLIVLPLFTWIIGNGIRRGAEAMGWDFDMSRLQQGPLPYLLALIIVIGLFISVLIHELGHAVTAKLYGVRTRSITLWLLGGVAQLEKIPRQRGAEAVVAIVGPIVSFALGALFWIILQIVPTESVPARYVLTYLARINVILAVFNLLPALPLDGGRVLRSLLAIRMDPLRATQVAGGISKVLAVALGLLGFMGGGIWLIFIAFFIYMAVSAETQQTLIEHMLTGIRVRDLMNRNVITVPREMTVGELTKLMIRERHLGFPVLDDAEQLVGIVELPSVQGAPPEATVTQVMSPQIRSIREDAPALDAFTTMARNGFGRLVAVDHNNRMVGIITKTDLMRAIQIRLAALGLRDPTAASRESLETELTPARS